MKKVFTLKLATLLAVALMFNGCKKGEDDPLLSLRTRKARLTGDWVLKKGQLTVQQESTKGSSNDRYDYTQDQLTYTDLQTSTVINGSYSLRLAFDKKGKFRIDEESAGIITEVSGDWDFEKGNGEAKNKEYINMTITAVGRGSIDYIESFNQSQSNFSYRIKELRNNKLVLVCARRIIGDYKKDSEKIWIESQYEFEQ